MNLLVCGGAGFIGSRFVELRLDTTSDRIAVLDKLTYAGGRDNLAEAEAAHRGDGRIRFVNGDIANADAVLHLVRDADAVVNLAAESHVDRAILDASAAVSTNIVGVHVLLGAIRAANAADGRNRRFLQVSTDEVYGPIDSGSHTEEDALRPRNPYAATKAAADLICLADAATYGLDVVITRGGNTYGPRQHPEKLVPLFVTNALEGLPLPLYGDGLQRRDWIHVDDHARGLSLILDVWGSGLVYNLSASNEASNLEVTRAILAALGAPASLVRHVEDRPGHDTRYSSDPGRARAVAWNSAIAFEAGLASTVDWYVRNESWWRARRGADWDGYYAAQYAARAIIGGRG